jgi:hypothetical protein
MPIRSKVIRVVANLNLARSWLQCHMLAVGHIRSAFWNEYALVPVVFFRLVRHFTLDGGLPKKNFFDDDAQMRKPWSICEGWEMRTIPS